MASLNHSNDSIILMGMAAVWPLSQWGKHSSNHLVLVSSHCTDCSCCKSAITMWTH